MRTFRVVIPVHNRVARTLGVLECLRGQVGVQLAVYLVDDGSTDGTSERVVEQFGGSLRLSVLKGDGNLWWAGATKLGVTVALSEAADDDVIVLMNDDVEFGTDLFLLANQELETNPNSLVGPLVVDDVDRDAICQSGIRMACWPLGLTYRPLEGERLSELESAPIIDVDFLGARATFVPVSIVRRIGNINAERLPHYHADGEYSYRAKQSGFRVLVSPRLVVSNATNATAAFNAFGGRVGMREFLGSWTGLKSPNNLRYRYAFALLACPRVYLLPYLVFDTLKVILRAVAYMIIGADVVRIRRLANRWLAPSEHRRSKLRSR